MTESPPVTRYAGIYATDRTRFVKGGPRTAEAATRLAHYQARLAARRAGRQPGDFVDVKVGQSTRSVNGIALFDEDLVAVRVEIETSDGTT